MFEMEEFIAESNLLHANEKHEGESTFVTSSLVSLGSIIFAALLFSVYDGMAYRLSNTHYSSQPVEADMSAASETGLLANTGNTLANTPEVFVAPLVMHEELAAIPDGADSSTPGGLYVSNVSETVSIGGGKAKATKMEHASGDKFSNSGEDGLLSRVKTTKKHTGYTRTFAKQNAQFESQETVRVEQPQPSSQKTEAKKGGE